MSDNILTDKYPELSKLLHPTKNAGININDLTRGSHENIWWLCENSHETRRQLRHKLNNRICPKCPKPKNNSLEYRYPAIAKEWDTTKNGELTPASVSCSCNILVHWKCSNGHEWKCAVRERTSGKTCPVCNNLPKEESLEYNYSDIANEWDYDKNGIVTPSDVPCSSNKIYWWICPDEGHEWQCEVMYRTRGRICIVCKPIRKIGKKTLADYQNVLKEWHPTKNKNIDPTKISSGSTKFKYWWLCQFDETHEWEASPYDMTKRNYGCAPCKTLMGRNKYNEKRGPRIEPVKIDNVALENKVTILTNNSLLSKCEALSKEWHPTKNNLTPTDVSYKSKRIVWWLCSNEHEWRCTVRNRTLNDVDCTECNRLAELKERSIVVTHPQVATEWDYNKNGNLLPEHVTFGNNRKVWFICKYGHEYRRSINARTSANGCPDCKIITIKPGHSVREAVPKIAEEWHPTKNGDLTPDNVSYGSRKIIVFICPQKHEYRMSLLHRTCDDRSCPKCKCSGFSKIAIRWLEEISLREEVYIRHAMNEGEYSIKHKNRRYKFDGYCEETNTVWEFNGCFYHGHPPDQCKLSQKYKFERHKMNTKSGKTYGELYDRTMKRLKIIKSLGYNVVTIWECEYKTQLKIARKKRIS